MRTCRFSAALVVIAWLFAALWLAGGVAYADDTTSHDSTPGTSHSGDQSATSADKPTASADKPTASADKPTASEEKTDTPTRIGKPRGARKHGTAKQATETTPDTKPDAKRGPDSDAKAGIKPKTTAAPEPDTKPLTTTAKKSGAAAAALKLASPAVLPSTTAKAPNPIAHAVQFVRQMTGLANDIGLLAVTVVNNLAAAAAATIGPKPFFGVPYHVASAIAGTAATAGKLLTGTPLNADSAVKGPFKVSYGVGDLLSYLNPNKSPAGANLPFTGMPADHPLPIILIAGTAANAPFNWSVGAPVLANAGYTVYTFNYGNVTDNPNWPVRGTADIRKSAAELSAEVDKVLQETGADKVILIGHSQGGGMTPEYYLNNLDGAAKVSQFIGIAPANHGADVDGLAYIKNIPLIGKPIFNLVNLLGPAWLQQAIGSPLIDEIYGDGDTRPGVLYTMISTKNDWIATPYTNQALNGPNVQNVVLQQLYPDFNAGHLGIVFAKPTWDVVLGALAANPAANRAPQDQTIAA